MKVLFIHPPANVNLKLQKGLKYPPLGICFISSVIRNQGHDARIFDANVEKNPFKTLGALLKEYLPNVVGISFTSLLSESAHYTAGFVKNILPGTAVVAGGYHPTVLPLDVIKDTNFDFVIAGEGEHTFSQWLKEYASGRKEFEAIPGLVFRKNSSIITTPKSELLANLDTIPFPAYDLLSIKRYSSMVSTHSPYVTFIRSRGCPFNCTFCGVQKMFGKRYRVQSAQKTITEIEKLVREFKVKEILFKDSDFLIDKENVRQLCELLIARNSRLIWSCNARVDMVNAELLFLMKQAGCKMITYGIESGNQAILDNLRKDFTLDDIRNAVKLTKAAGIQTTANIIFGGPGETKETACRTITFLKELDPDYLNCAYLTAFPGSSLFDDAKNHNWFIDGKPESFGYEQLRLNATTLSNAELGRLLKEATRSFYLRPEYIVKRLRYLSFAELKNDIKGLWAIITNS